MNRQKIYDNLPIFLQNAACSVEGHKLKKQRLSGKFRFYLKEYLERNNWSNEKIIKYRDQKLKEFVQHAYDTVPYYNKLFKELGIDPASITKLADLELIPILSKEQLRGNEHLFLSSNYTKSDLIVLTTGGSTGTSVKIFCTKNQLQEQFALWWKYRIELGITMDTWCADFGSRTIVPNEQKNPPFWRISKPLKQVKFSAFHGNDENYLSYYQEIRKRNLTWIHGYPTVITPFAAFLNANNLSLRDQIKFVTTGGENLYEFQRTQIKRAFGVLPHSHYGLGECVANFSEDREHNLFVDEDFAAVEFIENGNLFKIIGTNFTNYAMPLLRYDTGDLAVIDNREYDTGKRKINHVDGRSGELIHLPSGKRIGALSALFSATANISQAQIHQKSDYSLDIRYVSKASQSLIDSDLNKVADLLQSRLGSEVPFKFIKVDVIPRTKRGKQRYLISDFETNIESKTGGVFL